MRMSVYGDTNNRQIRLSKSTKAKITRVQITYSVAQDTDSNNVFLFSKHILKVHV